MQALRYADDLLILSRDARLGRKAVAAVVGRLKALRQQLRDPRAEPAPAEDGIHWLGVRLQPRLSPWTERIQCGYAIPDAKVKDMLARINEMTAPPSNRIERDAFNLGRWILSVNSQLRDWHQAYMFADNRFEVFAAVDDHCRHRIGGLIYSVQGVRGKDLYRQYRARLPRGFWTWQVDGCQLVILSALAPRCPHRLVRTPDWQRLQPQANAKAPGALHLEQPRNSGHEKLRFSANGTPIGAAIEN